MSETPTPPWGLRTNNEYADGIERLQTRLLHIGLFLLTVVVLGGGAGVLLVATGSASALAASVCVVAGTVIAVLVSLTLAMSATREFTPVARRQAPMPAPSPVHAPLPVPAPRPEPVVEVVTRAPEPAPLWTEQSRVDDPGQRREVFIKLARRLQSLINRAIKRIDELEQDNEDPVLLDGLYEIDHLFTLARRQGENLAVLGGEAPARRSSKPVSVYAVLLAAVSEAEHYRQISIVPVEDVEIHGHAVAEIIHLLAELLENATRFTSPDGPKVEVRAQKVTAGLAIEVQDRGLGMNYEDLERINRLLDGSTRIDISELLEDGRIGLAVVRELARRHEIKVRLQSNIFGGVAAAVVIPPQLLSEVEADGGGRRRAPAPADQQQGLPKREQPVPREPSPRPTPARQPEPVGAHRMELTGPQQTVAAQPSPAPRRAEQTGQRPAVPSLFQDAEPLSRTESVPVPAPVPIPTTSPGLGPTRPQPARRARPEPEPEEELPVLPVRAPGRSYDDLRAGGNGGIIDETAGENGEAPPPLPQRRGSHLREELLEPPAPTKGVPGHNVNLMKTVQAGREHWLAEAADRDEKTNEGDSTTWPTT